MRLGDVIVLWARIVAVEGEDDGECSMATDVSSLSKGIRLVFCEST